MCSEVGSVSVKTIALFIFSAHRQDGKTAMEKKEKTRTASSRSSSGSRAEQRIARARGETKKKERRRREISVSEMIYECWLKRDTCGLQLADRSCDENENEMGTECKWEKGIRARGSADGLYHARSTRARKEDVRQVTHTHTLTPADRGRAV